MGFILSVVWSLKRRKKGDNRKIIRYFNIGFNVLLGDLPSMFRSNFFTIHKFKWGKKGNIIINKNIKNGIIQNLYVKNL